MKYPHHMRAFREMQRSGRRNGGFIETLILFAVLTLVKEFLLPKPEFENAKPAGLGDFQFPTATQGRVVPLIWGTQKLSGPNVIWYGDLDQIALSESVKTGLFSSVDVVKGYNYRIGWQMALCRGEADELVGVFIGEDLVGDYSSAPIAPGANFTINEPELFGGNDLGNGGIVGTWTFYSGSASQAAAPYLSSFQSEGGVTPAYRGTSYVVNATQNAYLGNSTSVKPWSFLVRRIPNGLGLSSGQAELNGGEDANPANVIYEILTDTDWGLAIPTGDIDTTNFNAVAATLATEGNGFSYTLDRAVQAQELLRTVQEQIAGVIYQDTSTDKWKISLARADYTPGAQPLVDESNSKLLNYSRGSWANTANQVRVEFNDRANEFATTYSVAQDTANVRIQGANVSVTKRYPGVKDATLANDIAWRDLRTFAYPLAKATVEVDREFWDVTPNMVVELSNSTLGFTRLAMRVTRIDLGELESNRIRLDLVQDVFYSTDPSFADPDGTDWTAPAATLAAFPADEQIAIEAPRAIVRRDPRDGSLVNKIFASGRRNNNEVIYEIRQRNAAGSPAGDYSVAGTVFSFTKIGELNSALTTKSAYPLTTLDLTATPDSQADLIAAITETADTVELGTNLLNLLLVNDEFMLVESATDSGALVRLQNVYRGALDSVQADHASGDEVFVLSVGSGISDTAIPETNQVDVKLIPAAIGGEVLESAATTINFTMDKRIRRPLPPSLITLNTVDWDTTAVGLEVNGSNAEDFHVDVDIRRRDYRTADLGNEITALTEDAATTFGDFPTANSTDHQITVTHDPTGTNDAILGPTTFSGTNYSLLRIDILAALSGAVPTGDIRLQIQSSHDDGGETLTSRQTLVHDFAAATGLTGQFEFGLLDALDVSALYTATVNGTYSFSLSSSFSSSDVEARVNGGSWTTVISSGNTSGNIAGVVNTDTIEVRWTSGDTGLLKQLDMSAPGAGQDAFAILEN